MIKFGKFPNFQIQLTFGNFSILELGKFGKCDYAGDFNYQNDSDSDRQTSGASGLGI